MLEFNLTLEEMIPLIKKCSDDNLLKGIEQVIMSRRDELERNIAKEYCKEIFNAYPEKEVIILGTIKESITNSHGFVILKSTEEDFDECVRYKIFTESDLRIADWKIIELYNKASLIYRGSIRYKPLNKKDAESLKENGVAYLTVFRNEI